MKRRWWGRWLISSSGISFRRKRRQRSKPTKRYKDTKTPLGASLAVKQFQRAIRAGALAMLDREAEDRDLPRIRRSRRQLARDQAAVVPDPSVTLDNQRTHTVMRETEPLMTGARDMLLGFTAPGQ
jgi:hypothetical protein